MFLVSTGLKVYLALGYTDMRKSVNGLSMYIAEECSQDPLSGHLFVFCNRRRTIMKILYWDHNGFCIWYKRLERDRYRWPEDESKLHEIGQRELQWMLSGLAIDQPGAYEELHYQEV